MLDDFMLGNQIWGNAFIYVLQYMFETKYGVKVASVFHIMLCLENHLTYLIFECLAVKFSLRPTKVNNVNKVKKNHVREYVLGMPLIVMPCLSTTQILGVSLEQTVLYLMSSETSRTRTFKQMY
jgi:hypothetical protein